jgi:hypothetical protein
MNDFGVGLLRIRILIVGNYYFQPLIKIKYYSSTLISSNVLVLFNNYLVTRCAVQAVMHFEFSFVIYRLCA